MTAVLLVLGLLVGVVVLIAIGFALGYSSAVDDYRSGELDREVGRS